MALVKLTVAREKINWTYLINEMTSGCNHSDTTEMVKVPVYVSPSIIKVVVGKANESENPMAPKTEVKLEDGTYLYVLETADEVARRVAEAEGGK